MAESRFESPLTDAELRRCEEALLAERRASAADLELLTGSLADLREARSDASADDEHDPDGPTLAAEWSTLSGVRSELVGRLAGIDRALVRISEGTYGVCLRRGETIGLPRLEARPDATLCIDCARDVEGGRPA